MAEPDFLINPKYFPPDFVMEDPRKMLQDKRTLLVDHVLGMGELEFHHWKPRNVDRQEPVAFERRFWAAQSGQPASQTAAAAKALAATPSHYEGALSRLPEPAEAGPVPASARAEPRRSAAPHARISGSQALSSPYGSNRAADVHDLGLWEQRNFTEPPHFIDIPDPDDRLPPGADSENLHAPCSVPGNAEARAQWCILQAMNPAREGLLPVALFKACVTALCELPVRRSRCCGCAG